MKVFDSENKIKHLILDNKTYSKVNFILESDRFTKRDLVSACVGNACATAALKSHEWKITEDVMPISSILVTDIWNANNDVFTAEAIVDACDTPVFKPINWMHRGSEESENENIGVMIKSSLIHSDLPEMNYMTEDIRTHYLNSKSKTLSSKVHIKQDGLIWSQYFPTYAKKIKEGIEKRDLYVSMECFFEDFGYCLRRNENDENYIYVDRTEATSKMSDDLIAYDGTGITKYNGKKYQIGRWLKNIIFSGQGIVIDPANKRNGKILSIIMDNKETTKAYVTENGGRPISAPTTYTPAPSMAPVAPMGGGAPIAAPAAAVPGQPSLVSSPSQLIEQAKLPSTHQLPADGLLFFSTEEAKKVGEIKLGCSGYHIYQEDRHSDSPLLFAGLLGDPTDIEKQMKIPYFRPCSDEQELRFILQEMAKKGVQLVPGADLSTEQASSFQPSVPGGYSDNTTDQYNEYVAPTYRAPAPGVTPGGAEGVGYGSRKVKIANLNNKTEKVYPITRDNHMSQQQVSDQQLENAMNMATAQISQLRNKTAATANLLNQAKSHIAKLNAELAELQNFAKKVEVIANATYANKIGSDRVAEMQSLVGEKSYSKADSKELANMDAAAFASLKKAVTKVTSLVDSSITESKRITQASAQLRASKRIAQAPSLIVAQAKDIVNPAESLIGFALNKKRS